jgi:hypothetical protein
MVLYGPEEPSNVDVAELAHVGVVPIILWRHTTKQDRRKLIKKRLVHAIASRS